jgi:hypothetical protein
MSPLHVPEHHVPPPEDRGAIRGATSQDRSKTAPRGLDRAEVFLTDWLTPEELVEKTYMKIDSQPLN